MQFSLNSLSRVTRLDIISASEKITNQNRALEAMFTRYRYGMIINTA